jgi:hypothetical protein
LEWLRLVYERIINNSLQSNNQLLL